MLEGMVVRRLYIERGRVGVAVWVIAVVVVGGYVESCNAMCTVGSLVVVVEGFFVGSLVGT